MRKCTHVMSNHNNKIGWKYFNFLFLNIDKKVYSQLMYQKGLEKTIGSKHGWVPHLKHKNSLLEFLTSTIFSSNL